MPNISSKSDPIKIFDTHSTSTFGEPVKCAGYEVAYILLSTTGNATGTLKVAGTAMGTMDDKRVDLIDFSSPSTATNHWTYLESVNMENLHFATGKTGWALNGVDADNNLLLMVNVGMINVLNLELVGMSAGKVTASFVGFVLR